MANQKNVRGRDLTAPKQKMEFDGREYTLRFDMNCFRIAEDVLGEMDPRGAVFQWDGASIPVVSTLKACSGAAPLLVGFGQPEDHMHSPNESYGLNQFSRSMEWAERILAALSS